jgi:transglutaminase-like putative cysteine protease
VNDTRISSIKNPYFNLSKECDWNHPAIKNLANTIKASVPYNSNIDIYRMELANAVIRYLHVNISYDYSISKDQSALTTFQRKSGTCLGNTMLAGALLRALDIPVYFQTSYQVNKTDARGYDGGHIWVVAYLFYEGKYQWVPADPVSDFTKDQSNYYNNLINQPKYKYPFNKNAADWFIIGQGGKYFYPKGYGYWYDEIAYRKIS